MKRLLVLVSALLILITPATPAHAAKPGGEIMSMEPAAPVWGDTAFVVTRVTGSFSYPELVIGCHLPADPDWSYAAAISLYDSGGAHVELTFGAPPLEAECVLTLYGVKERVGADRYLVLDQHRFVIA